MSFVKKLTLSLSVIVTMAIAFVVGIVINVKPNNAGVVVNGDANSTSIEKPLVSEKPTTYTYAPNEIVIKKGASDLKYTYIPSVDSKDDSATTVAYEYVFGNTMDRATAVNLKSIDTTGVNVGYYYSTTGLDTAESITGDARYTLQKLANNGDRIYIYLIVSPTDETIPTTFTTSIVWYYGIPKDIVVKDNVSGTTSTQTIVTGQEVDKDTLVLPTAPEGYYFDSWYLDEKYTQLATNPAMVDQQLYARFANFPGEYLTEEGESLIINSPSGLSGEIVVPAMYDKGNGRKPVTGTSEYSLSGFESVTNLILPSTLISIGHYNYLSCSVDFTSCVNLISIGTEVSYGGTMLDLTPCVKLTTIGSYSFYGSSLTTVKLPKSVISIGGASFSAESITSIIIEEGNPVYDSRNNCNAIIETATNRLIHGCNTTVIPNTVQEISEYPDYAGSYWGVFSGYVLQNTLVIPSSVTKISSSAFYRCTGNIIFEDTTNWYDGGNNSYYTAFNEDDIVSMSVGLVSQAVDYTTNYLPYYYYKGGNKVTLDANGGTWDGADTGSYKMTFNGTLPTNVENVEDPTGYYTTNNYGFKLDSDAKLISLNNFYIDPWDGGTYMALAKVTFNANAGDTVSFDWLIHNNGNGCLIFGNLDTELSYSTAQDSSYKELLEYNIEDGGGNPINPAITYDITTTGEHYIYIKVLNSSGTVDVSLTSDVFDIDWNYDSVSKYLKVDDKIDELPTPTREGYTFAGWFTAPTGGTQVNVNDVTNDNITLYAQWTQN